MYSILYKIEQRQTLPSEIVLLERNSGVPMEVKSTPEVGFSPSFNCLFIHARNYRVITYAYVVCNDCNDSIRKTANI